MNLPGTVQPASPGLLGFDTNTVVTAAAAKQFFQQGYRYCGRYLSHGVVQQAPDLTNAEASDILEAGLALFAVQHVLPAGWSPTSALGTTFGTNAVNNARSIGLPAGMNLWCDLEGVKPGTSAQDVIDYCKAWFAAVFASQYMPGLYVGADAILDGSQLFHDLPFAHYWRSLSKVPDIKTRGYQMVQHHYQGTINGITIDTNATQTDNLGGQVLWLQAALEQVSVPIAESGEPTVGFGPSVNKGAISTHAIEVISNILKDSDNMRAMITSSARTPLEQAKAMFTNISNRGVRDQKRLYGPFGDMIIDVFAQQKAAGKADAETLKAMELKILEVGPSRVSRHCADFTKLVVVDIAPSSITNKNGFVAVATQYVANGKVSKFLHPGNSNDPAYHLEIPNIVLVS